MKRKESILKMQAILLKRREALRNALAGELSWLQTMPSAAVGDEVDSAIDAERDELNSQLAAAESRELAEIENALQSIRDGSYGNCENCGAAIPAARLQAIPYATLCIQCQRAAERESQSARPGRTALNLSSDLESAGDETYLSEYELY